MKMSAKRARRIAASIGMADAETASLKAIKTYLAENADEVEVVDAKGKVLDVKTVTITADAGEEIVLADPMAEEQAEETEDEKMEDDMEEPEEDSEAKSLRRRIARLEQKSARSPNGKRVTSVKDGADRWIEKYERYAKMCSRLGKGAVFSDGETALAFGADLRSRGLRQGNYEMAEVDRKFIERRNLRQKALATAPNSAGGALVPVEYADDMIVLKNEYGIARQLCGVRPMTSDQQDIGRFGTSVTATVNGENASITEDDPDFDNVTLASKEVSLITKVSNKLLASALPGHIDEVARDLARSAAYLEDNAFFHGDGTSTYGGWVGFDNVIDSNSASYSDSAANTYVSVTLADITAAMSLIPSYGKRLSSVGLRIVGSQEAFFQIFVRLSEAGSGNDVNTLVNSEIEYRWRGIPYIVDDTFANTAGGADTETAFYIGYFDLAAKMGEQQTLSIDTDTSGDYFARNQTAYRMLEYLAINVHEGSDTSTAGPVIRCVL